ncbi:hypothetical protein ABZP36_001114 [Zizania latifolia]
MDMDKATAAPSSSAAAEVVGAGLGVREDGVGARKARNARMSVRPPIGMDLGMDQAVFLELVCKFVANEERRKVRRLARLARRRARNAKKRARRAAAAAAARAESAAATAPLRLPDEEGPPAAAAAADHQDPHEASADDGGRWRADVVV